MSESQPVSRQTKSAASKSARAASRSRAPAESTEIPRVSTPSNGLDLQTIWLLLREMQQQVLSMQESMQEQIQAVQSATDTVDRKIEDIEGTLGNIKRTCEGIALQLVEAEGQPRTPPTHPGGAEATPRPPTTIHLPMATRPHERSTLLPPPGGTSLGKPFVPGATDFWGNPKPPKPEGEGFRGTNGPPSARTSPDQKPYGATRQSPINPRAAKPPKMREPKDLDGTKGKVAKQWVTKAMLWANAQLPNYENEQAIVTRLFLFMKPGLATDWAQPHIERIVDSSLHAVTTRRGFKTAFNEAFGDPETARTAARKMEALKQEGSISEYTTAFENLRADLDWNGPGLMSQYERGLQHCIQTQLAFAPGARASLHSMQTTALTIGNTYAALNASRPPRTTGNTDKKGKGRDAPPGTSSTTKSDGKSSIPNFVEKEERDARRAEGLCIKCGAPGHGMKQCKNGYSIKRLSTNKGEELKKEVKKEAGKVGEARKVTIEAEDSGSEELGKE